jgi:tetratricopeptide (TPR) repeat protein
MGESVVGDIEKARQALKDKLPKDLGDPEKPPQVTPEARKAAEAIVRSPSAGKDETLDALKTDASAFLVTGQPERAERILRKANVLYPNDPDALLRLAQSLLNSTQVQKAIPVLEELSHNSNAPIVTWKLLGYAYLWRKDKRNEAIAASRKYLASLPNDEGTRLNLACALAQPGPKAVSPTERAEILDILRELAKDAGWKVRIKELTLGDEDLAGWVGDKDFDAIIA